MTKSTGTRGFTFPGSPPNSTIASRRAAMSTTAGTPVKSCNNTRLGLKGISSGFISGDQAAILLTSSSDTKKPSQFRRADSSKIRIENGKSSSLQRPAFSRAESDINLPDLPLDVSNFDAAEKGSFALIKSPMILPPHRRYMKLTNLRLHRRSLVQLQL